MKLLGLLAFLAFAFPSEAKWKMLLRADEYNPYKLPNLTLMPNMDVACSNQAVAVRYWRKTSDQVIGIQTLLNAEGEQWQSEEFGESELLSQPQITHRGELLFSVNTLAKTSGVFLLGADGMKKVELPSRMLESRSLTAPKPFAGSFLVRRLRHDSIYDLYFGSQRVLSEEDGFSKIYLPQVRGQSAVFKLSEGRPGQTPTGRGAMIVGLKAHGFGISLQPLIRTRHLNPGSVFTDFDNSPQPLGNNGVVFIGQHVDEGRGLYFYHRQKGLRILATENRDDLKVEYFAPNVNIHGDVVFRAKDADGARGIYWANAYGADKGTGLRKLIAEGQILNTNEPGGSRVIQRRGWPAFSGRPCITDSRDLLVHAVLEAPGGGHNHGSAIFQESLESFF